MDKRTHREEMRPAETLVAVNLDGASLDEQRIVDILE